MSIFLKLMVSAKEGDSKAQYAPGSMFYEGDGVAKDHAQAALFFAFHFRRNQAHQNCNL